MKIIKFSRLNHVCLNFDTSLTLGLGVADVPMIELLKTIFEHAKREAVLEKV